MTLLDTLKSLLGLKSDDRRADDDDVGVTVEREAGREPEPPSSPSGNETEASGSATTDAGAVEHDDEETDDGAVDAEAEDDVDDGHEDADDGAADAETDDGAGSDEPTDVLEGIGPTYAERLSDAGIDTVAQLAAADAAELAPQIDNVGEGRVQDWIDRATDR